MLTPASAATSVRRSPGTRRLVPAGRPARSGVILARRETRNSRTSVRLSTASTVRPAPRRWGALPVHLPAGTPQLGAADVCWRPSGSVVPEETIMRGAVLYAPGDIRVE